MIWVVDKKVIKHTIDAGTTLVEVPIRISFEYGLQDDHFVNGTVTREFIYNGDELSRRFPGLDREAVKAEIEGVVDQTIVEHLKFAGYAAGDVELFASSTDESEQRPDETRKIVLPSAREDE